ncbi:MAG: hypothetical protein JSU94_01470, partial [Phycisphaerales bacterium]
MAELQSDRHANKVHIRSAPGVLKSRALLWLFAVAVSVGVVAVGLLVLKGRSTDPHPAPAGALSEKQSRQTLASSEAPGKGAALPVPQATDLPQGSAAKNNAEQSIRTVDPVRWSWRDSTGGGQVTWTAQGAFEEATKYVLSEQPRQRQALRLYQKVLDANPPRELELHVKLTMGARMTALYDPDLGEDSLDEEAIRWYERIVEDFNDWRNHHDLMVAKI